MLALKSSANGRPNTPAAATTSGSAFSRSAIDATVRPIESFVGYFAAGSDDVERHHVIRIESRVDVLEVGVAAEQQARPDEQDDGQRHLADDERLAQA